MRFFTPKEKFTRLGLIEKAKRNIQIIDEIFDFKVKFGMETTPAVENVVHMIKHLSEVVKGQHKNMSPSLRILTHQMLDMLFPVLASIQQEILSLINTMQRTP